MKWITRAHVHVDRVACPWLINRFVDAQAERAQEENAIPFDISGCELGHRDGHCSFVSILKKYNLKDPALLALSEVVDAADTGALEANPYAHGLEAIATGFSLLHPFDPDNLQAQFGVYDGLYAFFKLQKRSP